MALKHHAACPGFWLAEVQCRQLKLPKSPYFRAEVSSSPHPALASSTPAQPSFASLGTQGLKQHTSPPPIAHAQALLKPLTVLP